MYISSRIVVEEPAEESSTNVSTFTINTLSKQLLVTFLFFITIFAYCDIWYLKGLGRIKCDTKFILFPIFYYIIHDNQGVELNSIALEIILNIHDKTNSI